MSDIKVKPMKVRALVEHALNGINHDRLEIRPGPSNMLMIHEPYRAEFYAQATRQSRSIGCRRRQRNRAEARIAGRRRIRSPARRLSRHAVCERGCCLAWARTNGPSSHPPSSIEVATHRMAKARRGVGNSVPQSVLFCVNRPCLQRCASRIRSNGARRQRQRRTPTCNRFLLRFQIDEKYQ
jgi:hypothetical protein